MLKIKGVDYRRSSNEECHSSHSFHLPLPFLIPLRQARILSLIPNGISPEENLIRSYEFPPPSLSREFTTLKSLVITPQIKIPSRVKFARM